MIIVMMIDEGILACSWPFLSIPRATVADPFGHVPTGFARAFPRFAFGWMFGERVGFRQENVGSRDRVKYI